MAIVCKWPIKFLQDKLLNIYTGDLWIFGASSGFGKSTISRMIAMEANQCDNSVVLYSLENKPGTYADEETRILYNKETGSRIEARAFKEMENKDKDAFIKYRQMVYENSKKTNSQGLKLLKLHEDVRGQNIGVDELLRSIQQEYNEGYRLFLIDHVDMLITNERNELAETISNMNKLWAFVANHDVAFIVFSQLRELPPNVIIANEEQLRGSKTKGQRATGVITLAPHDYGIYQAVNHPFAHPTYIRIAKSRDGRSSTGCAVCFFENDKYLDGYKEIMCDKQGVLVGGLTREKMVKYKQQEEEKLKKAGQNLQYDGNDIIVNY